MTDDTDRPGASDPGPEPDVDPADKTQPAEGGVDEAEDGNQTGGAEGGDPSRVRDEG